MKRRDPWIKEGNSVGTIITKILSGFSTKDKMRVQMKLYRIQKGTKESFLEIMHVPLST